MSIIPDTNFTIEWITEKLKEKLNFKAELKSWKSQRIGMGEGFASTIVLVEFEWNEEVGGTKSVVLKIPNTKTALAVVEKSDDSFDELFKHFHHNETAAYRFLPQNEGLRIPKVFHSESIESGIPIIMMESFHQNACTAEITNGLDLNQVLQVVDLLAKAHAHSLKSTDWVDKFIIDRKDFEMAWATFVPLLKTVITPLDPEYFEEKLKKLTFVFDPEYSYQLVIKLHEKLGLPPVLVHGDLWISNLLWERSTSGKAGQNLLAVIDWQISHAGNCCEDIARLLATSCSGQMRRANTDKILSFYHEKLAEYMGDAPVPFSLEKVKEIYNRILPYGLVFLLFTIPFWLKGKAFDGKDRDKYIREKVNDVKIMIDDVMRLEQNMK